MTLDSLLGPLERYLPECEDFAVVALHLFAKSKEHPRFQHVMSRYADDSGSEIIWQTVNASADGPAPRTLRSLREQLLQLQPGRADYSVECSDQGPDVPWRLDCPVTGFGVNAHSQVFAFLW